MIARARVQIIVDFTLPGSWGDDCTAGQITKQAREEATTCLMNGLSINGLKSSMVNNATPAVIVGKPIITMILAEDK